MYPSFTTILLFIVLLMICWCVFFVIIEIIWNIIIDICYYIKGIDTSCCTCCTCCTCYTCCTCCNCCTCCTCKCKCNIIKYWKNLFVEPITDTCTICLEEVTNKPYECGHVYHDKCIKTWLKEHNTCPNCRINIEII